ncbi:hypothetical protein Tco_0445987 [Tanacetum coccineum]
MAAYVERIMRESQEASPEGLEPHALNVTIVTHMSSITTLLDIWSDKFYALSGADVPEHLHALEIEMH